MIDENFFQLFTIFVEDSKWLTATIDKTSWENSINISHDELRYQRTIVGRKSIFNSYDDILRSTKIIDDQHFIQIAFG